MKLIDTNALVVLILGIIDPRLIGTHRRTSIYDENDYFDLIAAIGGLEKLVVLPNVWTETDNLLNGTIPNRQFEYVQVLKQVVSKTTEEFLSSKHAVESEVFYHLGITDTLLLNYAPKCDLLITSDSMLSDHARSRGIRVFDIVANKNARLS